MTPPPLVSREAVREQLFGTVWSRELNAVFADVAPYYDRANNVASLGLWNRFLEGFMSTIALRPGMRVLDIAAGTNAVGIALLRREPRLEVHAMDRSPHMQEVGRRRAAERGFTISSVIGDVHELPYPDSHFDLVTLQFASRHLRIRRVLEEVLRVLRPGGHFHHCDMLRPASPLVEELYYGYLRLCLNFTALVFRSGTSAMNCRKYFVNAVRMFYSAAELSELMRDVGYRDVRAKTVLCGMLGYHGGAKPLAG
jgi:demethylmenaquinone methyltransferase / 2-methoxy-6-polyprenyl-1,4-benzoquinol methylase